MKVRHIVELLAAVQRIQCLIGGGTSIQTVVREMIERHDWPMAEQCPCPGTSFEQFCEAVGTAMHNGNLLMMEEISLKLSED